MLQIHRDKNSFICFDDSVIADPTLPIFDAEYWQQQRKVTGSASGRGTTWFVQLDSMQAALRHYRRGGLLGKLVEDRYLFSGWDTTRSIQEFKLLQTLMEAGVNVPRPIAARAVRSGYTYRADLLSERISNAKDLVAILQENPLSEAMYKKIGQEIAKMHQAHVNHTDLNIHNILIDDQNTIWIIDFDKCALEDNSAYSKSNLDRLLRSFRKEKVKCNIAWEEESFSSLMLGYRTYLHT